MSFPFKENDCYSGEFIVTESVYHGFLQTFKDQNILHTDENYAREKGFANKVMHGNILNGFLSFFVGEMLPVKNVIIHSQEIQFRNPVYLDDKLHFEANVSGVFESVNSVEFKFSFVNEKKNCGVER